MSATQHEGGTRYPQTIPHGLGVLSANCMLAAAISDKRRRNLVPARNLIRSGSLTSPWHRNKMLHNVFSIRIFLRLYASFPLPHLPCLQLLDKQNPQCRPFWIRWRPKRLLPLATSQRRDPRRCGASSEPSYLPSSPWILRLPTCLVAVSPSPTTSPTWTCAVSCSPSTEPCCHRGTTNGRTSLMSQSWPRTKTRRFT